MGMPECERLSAEAFLDWVEKQSERFELVEGVPIRMIGRGQTEPQHRDAQHSRGARTGREGGGLPHDVERHGRQDGDVRRPVSRRRRGLRSPDPSAKAATRPTLVVEVSSPGTLAVDLTDKMDEYRAHDDIRVIMLVEPDVVFVKVYRRETHGRWTVERYDGLDQTVHLPDVRATVSLRAVYDTLEPKSRPRLNVVAET